MDYRMFSDGVVAGQDAVALIRESLKAQNIKMSNIPLKMVAFEGAEGTKFYLNGHAEPMEIPSTGQFVTPYGGAFYMPIYKLTFEKAFTGNIYYII